MLRALVILGTALLLAVCVFELRRLSARPAMLIGGKGYERVELQLNAFTDSIQNQPSLSFGPDGELLVAWQSRRQLHGRSGVCFRTFDKDGKPGGGEQLVSQDTSQAQILPAAVIDGGGEGLVFFSAMAHQTRPPNCMVRPLGGDARRLAPADVPRGAITATRLRDGSIVAAFSEDDARLFLCRVNRAGAQVGGLVEVGASPVGGAQSGVRSGVIAALRDGGCAVAWTGVDPSGDGTGIWMRVFDRTLRPAAPTRRWLLDNPAGATEPALIGAGDGGFCLACMHRRAGAEDYDVVAGRFAADGSPLGDTVIVSLADTPQSGVSLAAIADGRILIAWNRHSADFAESDIFAAVLDRAIRGKGTRGVGEVLRLNHFVPGRQALPAGSNRGAIAVGPGGQIAAVWAGDSGNGDGSAVNLTVLCPADSRLAKSWRELARSVGAHRATTEGARPPVTSPYKVPPAGPNPAPAGLVDFGFDSIPDTGWGVPDSHCAVGPDHVVAVANSHVRFLKKDGTVTFQQNLNGSGGFWGNQGAGATVFDPETIYDPHSGRFMVIAAEMSRAYLFAVSDDADPNGTWHKYRFTSGWPANLSSIDSPTIAVDDKAVYLGADFRSGTSYHISIYPKAALLAGKPAASPKSLTFPRPPGWSTLDVALGLPVHYGKAPALYMIGHYPGRSTKVRVYAITNPLTTPKVTTLDLTVPSYDNPAAVKQKGTTVAFLTVDARMWHCVWRDGSLWACHHQGQGQVTTRWYEIQTGAWPASGAPKLIQTGDIKPGTSSAFMASISADAYGNAMVCYARSSANEFASIARVWRRKGDALGTMRQETIVRQSSGYFSVYPRWGDFSSTVVDPQDGASFWYTHEYLPRTNRWSCWVGRFRAQPPTLSADKGALSATTGGVVNFKLDNPILAGKLFALAGSVSGTSPGFNIARPPDYLHLPLNPDLFTDLTLAFANTPTFQNFRGKLDARGQAAAKLVVPPVPRAKGVTMHFLFVQDGTALRFASDVVAVKLN